jgi:hypothetical protein
VTSVIQAPAYRVTLRIICREGHARSVPPSYLTAIFATQAQTAINVCIRILFTVVSVSTALSLALNVTCATQLHVFNATRLISPLEMHALFAQQFTLNASAAELQVVQHVLLQLTISQQVTALSIVPTWTQDAQPVQMQVTFSAARPVRLAIESKI